VTSYVRAYAPGGVYFFTVALADRRSRLLLEEIGALRQAFGYVKQRLPFEVEAIVVLPEHLHAIWRLPEGDCDFSTRWMMLKGWFSRALPTTEARSTSRISKRERGIWQRRFWEHLIRDEADFERHLDYIHFNPVKHGHADSPSAWPYSSFRKLVARGWYELDWAAGDAVKQMERE
jgi:putative transposase